MKYVTIVFDTGMTITRRQDHIYFVRNGGTINTVDMLGGRVILLFYENMAYMREATREETDAEKLWEATYDSGRVSEAGAAH